MDRGPIDDVIRELEVVLAAEGVRGALRFLNSRAPHRFTGIYRLEPPVLRNVHLFDRENPELDVSSDVALRETYCSITGSSGEPFATADARADERLGEHPARESTLSYCGVPLIHESEAVGTLCHFDLIPRPIPHPEIALMHAAAARIVTVLHESGELPHSS